MKWPTLPTLLMVFLASLAGCQLHGEPQESDDPLFFLLKRLDAVEKVRNRIYPEARQSILASGWTPLPRQPEAGDRTHHEAVEEFLKRGFVEIEDCDGNQPTFCHFVFTDSLGNKLLVTTTDTERQPLPALVTYTQVLSEYKPSDSE